MPEQQTVVIKVGMHCEGCRRKVKKALAKIPGIEELKVDMKEQKVTIRGDVDVKKVMSRIARTGKVNEIVQPQPANQGADKPKEAPPAAPAAQTPPTSAPSAAPPASSTAAPATASAPVPSSLATTEAATKEAILKDIQMKPMVWIDAPDFLSDENPNACSVM